ncbi:hypothetical protein B0T16DRAFT_156334 [Cercophora newfieldiana]|uniref:Uncharacterized protein n=1 Tax=Cercophora newfieldiana TaxID=92897 RepID=A0AA39Y5S0_9PEZI|nr:hypothetical protein B0T16DRAFT_156334 [Cercophora newfieldiana]
MRERRARSSPVDVWTAHSMSKGAGFFDMGGCAPPSALAKCFPVLRARTGSRLNLSSGRGATLAAKPQLLAVFSKTYRTTLLHTTKVSHTRANQRALAPQFAWLCRSEQQRPPPRTWPQAHERSPTEQKEKPQTLRHAAPARQPDDARQPCPDQQASNRRTKTEFLSSRHKWECVTAHSAGPKDKAVIESGWGTEGLAPAESYSKGNQSFATASSWWEVSLVLRKPRKMYRRPRSRL